jgi:hypothetical protein
LTKNRSGIAGIAKIAGIAGIAGNAGIADQSMKRGVDDVKIRQSVLSQTVVRRTKIR